MEIIIDLKSKHRTKQNIALLWDIDIQENETFWDRFPFVRRHKKIEKTVNLQIENIVIDSHLVCKEDKLFSIEYNGSEYSQHDLPVSVPLNNFKNSFQLFVDQNAIVDCQKKQERMPDTFQISFDLVLYDEDDVQIDRHHESLDVKFVQLDIKPHVIFDCEEETIQYSSELGVVKVGNIVAWVEESYKMTPEVDLDVEVNLLEGKKDLTPLVYMDKGENQRKLRLKPGKKNAHVVPVYVDFSQYSNPIQDCVKLTLRRRASFAMSYSQEIIQPMPVELDEFQVLKDQQGTELKVYALRDGEAELMTSSHEYHTSELSFLPFSRMMPRVSVDIANIATDSSNRKAGLVIKNMAISESLRDHTVVLDENEKSLSQLVALEGDEIEGMSGSTGYVLRNGKDSKTRIEIVFDPSRIADIIRADGDYRFQLDSVLTFDYWENKDGLDLDKVQCKHFVLPVVWNLYLEPYPEWLCVDYGTSAIVCKYNKDLIDLKLQKDKIFRKYYSQFRTDVLEKGTKFLSSDIVLHTIEDSSMSTLCSEHKEEQPYNTLSVCLSPTSSMIKQDVKTQLPCLKILIGNIFLPGKADYNTFMYTRNGANGAPEKVTAEEVKDENNSLLRISSIFKEAYCELFRYFISPVMGENRRLNKLVLTYPNTYTPAHLKVLRKIATETFHNLREGYLKFVSESDAVAAFYLDHWSEFNSGRDIRKAETVLVFDMGAGTLDVTLLEKFVNRKTQKMEVNIKGKIGSGKAGNYLDFVIAEIICEILGIESADLASTKPVVNVAVLQERLKLKQAIVSEIKPNLIPGQTLSYDGRSISADEIIEHPKFQMFLREVTSDIIKRLAEFMGVDELHLDTVIMSGRSCKLEILRNALQNRLISESDLDRINFVDFEDERQKDRQKIVVVEGAVAQAGKFDGESSQVCIKSRRLYASYGLVYQVLGGQYKYAELLNHNDVPFMDQPQLFESDNVLVEGTASASVIKLVQTYLSPQDTEACINRGDYEFIAEMEEYDMADFKNANTLNAKLRLDSNNNISIFMNGKISKGSAPRGVDLASEITKRSIWPVTI